MWEEHAEKINRLVKRMHFACMDLGRYNRLINEQAKNASLDKLYSIAEKLKTMVIRIRQNSNILQWL